MRIGGRTVIGLDLGHRAFVAVQLSHRSGVWALEAGFSMARSVAGPAAGSEQPSVEELKRLCEALNRQGFIGNRVVVAAPSSKVMSAALELPPRSSGAPVEDLAKQELARAARKSPDSIEVASWEVPAPPRAADGTSVLAVGLAHEDAEGLLDALEGAGFFVEALDCRCLATSRACRSVLGDGAHVSSILDLSEGAASLTIVHSGIVAYDRPMREAGLGQVRASLSKELKVDSEGVDFVMETIAMQRGDGELPEHTVRAARGVVDEHVGMIVQELRSVMAYAMHRYPGSVGPVLLTGPGATLVGLDSRIRSELDLDARVVRPSELMQVPPELSWATDDPSLCTAAGLAMHVSQAVRRAA